MAARLLFLSASLALLVAASPVHAQGGPPTELSADPYARATVCAASLAVAAQATRPQDATVADAMEDGMGRWLLRAVNIGAKAGRSGPQVQSAVEFQMSLLKIFIADPNDGKKVMANIDTCRNEAMALPSK